MRKIPDVLQLVSDGARDVSGRAIGPIDAQTRIDRLGLDSVARVELVCYVEERLGFRLRAEDVARIETVGDLARLAQQRVPRPA